MVTPQPCRSPRLLRCPNAREGRAGNEGELFVITKLTCFITVGALLLGLGPQAARADDSVLVDQWLKDHGATRYTITPLTDDYIGNTLPGSYFGVYFQQWPIAIEPPQGLAPSNVFFVVEQQVYYLTNPDGLKGYFLNVVQPVQNQDQALDVARSWLRLSVQFSQDGYFRFAAPVVHARTRPTGEILVGGTDKVASGGTGKLKVHMEFDAAGALADVVEQRTIHAGVRPICQATKLLDADPIVRRMAERDILVMGRTAKAYLDEQRARATPELRQAIDRIWKRIVAEGR
jgi:hypothetical protein